MEPVEYDPRFVECEMSQAVTDDLGLFKIQGSILGFLKITARELMFTLVFSAVFLHIIQCKRQKLPQYLPFVAECVAG